MLRFAVVPLLALVALPGVHAAFPDFTIWNSQNEAYAIWTFPNNCVRLPNHWRNDVSRLRIGPGFDSIRLFDDDLCLGYSEAWGPTGGVYVHDPLRNNAKSFSTCSAEFKETCSSRRRVARFFGAACLAFSGICASGYPEFGVPSVMVTMAFHLSHMRDVYRGLCRVCLGNSAPFYVSAIVKRSLDDSTTAPNGREATLAQSDDGCCEEANDLARIQAALEDGPLDSDGLADLFYNLLRDDNPELFDHAVSTPQGAEAFRDGFEQFLRLMRDFDENGDGTVDVGEFTRAAQTCHLGSAYRPISPLTPTPPTSPAVDGGDDGKSDPGTGEMFAHGGHRAVTQP